MGSRGPLPKPGSSESERGRNTANRRTKIDPEATLPKCPGDLPDDAAKRFWKQHAKSLFEKGWLTPQDVPAFVRLCHTWSQLCELDQKLKDEGLTTVSSTGVCRAHPAASLRVSTEKQFLALSVQFGMSPTSRQRVPPAENVEPVRMRRQRDLETKYL
ncbi:phage terminase small subunit P27 family [Fuerstiella marisgermanici]|uniref:Putative phage terminase, small subunit, P27 family n=1 Tax=Fuerstiella marisgermanici TaxID=1891926 RepID=A0A1P8W8Z1_9PLAN|nr:putative phage terminase, small subunit, P27 family [Fuerstiella marisgermanici]